jgi:SpoIID/LytB domain protein
MSTKATEPQIKVGLLKAQQIHFELKGNFLFEGKIVPAGSYTAAFSKYTFSTSFAQKQTRITLQAADQHATFIIKNVSIGIGFHWQQEENQEFEGNLTLQIEDDAIRVLNLIPLEAYLKSVISSEMSAMNDLTLLKVHAIVSRSWLLAQINNKKDKSSTAQQIPDETNAGEIVRWYDREDHHTFDVCADDHCQRYQGITKVLSDNAQKAVDATRGQVLMYNNEICDARFSKCCGGFSEDFENAWQALTIPYLSSVRDAVNKDNKIDPELSDYYTSSPEAFCNTSAPEVLSQVLIDFDRSTTDFYRWKLEYQQEELAALLKRKSGIDFGPIVDLLPIQRGPSGRIVRLKILGTKKIITVGKELEIRKWLSESHLYSSAFTVEKHFHANRDLPSAFTLHGAGWGHGVGMCQIGAAVMSRQAYTLEEILKHYYRGAVIEQIFT